MNPLLAAHLPNWLLDKLDVRNTKAVLFEDADKFDQGFAEGQAWALENEGVDFPIDQHEQTALLQSYDRLYPKILRLPESARQSITDNWGPKKGSIYTNNDSYLRGWISGAATRLKEAGAKQPKDTRFIEAIWTSLEDSANKQTQDFEIAQSISDRSLRKGSGLIWQQTF